jgi:putative transposase
MANSFSQIYIQIVFSVKFRERLLQKPWRDDLFKYIAGIIHNKKQKAIIVNGVSDHVHIFIGYKPATPLPDLVHDIKNNSSAYINERGLTPKKFAWQDGYAAFSYSHSHIQNVYNYILNQEAHHSKMTFQDEYLKLLRAFEVEFDEKYVFG